MSALWSQAIKSINQQKYEEMKNYSKLIEKSLKESDEKLEIKENQFAELSISYQKLISTNDSLTNKLNLAQMKLSLVEKELELSERENELKNENTNGSYDSVDSDNKLRNEINCLFEKLNVEQNKNRDLEKQLNEKISEVKKLNNIIANSSLNEIKVNDDKSFTEDKTPSQSITDKSKEKLIASERRSSIQKEFLDVIKTARIKKRADFINKTDNVGQDFVDLMIGLAKEAIDNEFKNYSELGDYMRNIIREKYGHYYSVTLGKYDSYNSSSWRMSSRKTLSFKISDLGFTICQIHTECQDLLNTLKWNSNVETITRNELIDANFEKCVSDLAIESIGKDFTCYAQISEFISESLSKRFGKKWFVTIGVYDNYDLSLSISHSNNRKFMELLIKDLRFTIFQAV